MAGAFDSSTLVMSISYFRRAAHRLRALASSSDGIRARVAALLALVVLVAAAACSEQLDSGKTCGTLCPLANQQLRDTVIDPVALDTTLSGFPVLGATRSLFVATAPAPDSLDVRAVIRFDSIPSKYGPAAGGDSVPITAVDSTYLRLIRDTTTSDSLTSAATLEAYDVDTPSGADTATATLAALFTPNRLIGSVSLPKGRIYADTIRVKLSDSAFAAKAQAGARLRIGLRLVSPTRAQLRIRGVRSGTSLSAYTPTLTFDAATDTGYKAVPVTPASSNPPLNLTAQGAAIDQTLVLASPRAPLGTDLVVGGSPGLRTLIEFNIPIGLSDSTDVVRAVLELTQKPVHNAVPLDSVHLRSEAVLATTTVTDPFQAALLASPAGLSVDSLTLSPVDSGVRQLSLVTLVRSFRAFPSNTIRAIALRVPLEGAQASELRFFSNEAPVAVRPRLRLTYVPRTSFGVP
ncbi:MAG TPA: hypothetical protein VGD56_00625 [Gemmatirosa sp.]